MSHIVRQIGCDAYPSWEIHLRAREAQRCCIVLTEATGGRDWGRPSQVAASAERQRMVDADGPLCDVPDWRLNEWDTVEQIERIRAQAIPGRSFARGYRRGGGGELRAREGDGCETQHGDEGR